MHSTLTLRLLALAAVAGTLAHAADNPSAADMEFFETRVRPVLAKNCYGCHSSEIKSPMGGLFLDSRNGVVTGGKSGPAIVPGDPNASLLIRAVRYQGPKMPPSGQMSDAIVDDLVKWVAMGAPDPREAKAAAAPSNIDIEKGRKYWAFQAPVKPAPPKVRNAKWPYLPEDRFVLARIEKERLAPVADAGRATWLRRVTLDLTGLPPTPEESDAFAADHSKNAYEKVVDRLLASPRFGERWGRHWLDVARYADTVGRGRNYPFPVAWKYRDWVIDAFNRDMPYDQFVREQVAGDLLPADSTAKRNEQLTAVGFLALGSHDLVEQNPTVFTMDVVDEQINATSRAFMGITVGCARCHDHKFDPIPTTDYYAMAGIFKSTDMLPGLQRRPRDNASYFKAGLLAQLSHDGGDAPQFLPDPAQHAEYDKLQAELTELNQNPRRALAKKGFTPQQGMGAQAEVVQKLRAQANEILSQLDEFPLPTDLVMAVRDSASPADCEVYIHGEAKDLGPKVPRGFPQVMSAPGEAAAIAPNESGRLELAQWLTRKDNPTTARVAVNRIWEHLFGRGIVATADNFGLMGEKPSDQPLLDYLAVRFVEQGWSTKKLIRELVLSHTYRLSTAANLRDDNIDPGNVFLWRANRLRLEAEPIRDSLLMIGGQLDLNPPSVAPSMTLRRSVVVGGGRGGIQQDYANTMHNRSIYVPVIRNFLPPMFETFDFPEPSETHGVRDVTTVPTQALFMMNSRFVIDQARHAAERLIAANLATPQDRVSRVYREVLGRVPTADEVTRAMIFVHSAQEEASSQPAQTAAAPDTPFAARKNGRPGRGGRGPAAQAPLPPIAPEASAWEHLYQALFASAEFRYRG
jgi:hypothetical protein